MGKSSRNKTKIQHNSDMDESTDTFWSMIDPPEDISQSLWIAIKSIKSDTSTSFSRIQELEKLQLKQSDEISFLRRTVSILECQLKRSHTLQNYLLDEVESLKLRSMAENIIITFDSRDQNYRESAGENCVALVMSFLNQVLTIPGNHTIFAAHRLGSKILGKQRPIIAKIPDANLRANIFKNTSRLRNTNHFITSQKPPSCVERKNFLLPDFKQLKADPQNHAVIKQDKLYIKGQLQKRFLKPDLPNIATTEHSSDNIISYGGEQTEGGNLIKGFAAITTSLEEVAHHRQQLMNRPDVATSDHVIYAYRIQHPDGTLSENFDSDRDWNSGLEILNYMKGRELVNALFITTRTCSDGHFHIGKKRFEIMKGLCNVAYDALKEPKLVSIDPII